MLYTVSTPNSGEVATRYAEQLQTSIKKQLTAELKKAGATGSGSNSASGLATRIIQTALAAKGQSPTSMEQIVMRAHSIAGATYSAFLDEGKFGGSELLTLNELLTPAENKTVSTPISDDVAGEENAVDNAADSDYNGNAEVNTQGGIEFDGENEVYHGSGRMGQGNTDSQSRFGALQNDHGGEYRDFEESGDSSGSDSRVRNQGNQRVITEQQKESLKSTAIKNADGSPKAVYHFTDNMEFTVFAKGDTGFHFGSMEQAQNRGRNTGKQGRIIEVYLDIKNPIRIPKDIMTWRAGNVACLIYAEGVITEIQYLTILEAEKEQGTGYDSPAAVELRRLLKEKGYDGIVYENMFEGDGESYIALYPEQVIILDDGLNQSTEAGSDDGSAFSVDYKTRDNSDSSFAEPDLRRDPKLPRNISTKEEKIIRKICDALGLEVEFAWLNDPKNPNGYIKGRKVMLNYNATDPIRFVLKHEFTHYFETSKHYERFEKYVLEESAAFKEWLDRAGFHTLGAAIADAKRRYGDIGYTKLKREIIADFVGDMLFNKNGDINASVTEDFLSELARKDRNLFERFVEWIESLVKRLKGTAVEKDIIKLEQMVKRLKETVDADRIDPTKKNSYAGEHAKTADVFELDVARDRLRFGDDPERVRQETGWFKGLDGKWRFEINDQKLAFTDALDPYFDLSSRYQKATSLLWGPTGGTLPEPDRKYCVKVFHEYDRAKQQILTLGEAVRHDGLFAAYPELRDVKLQIGNIPDGGTAYYDPDEDLIKLNILLFSNESLLKETLIHEMQHGVQLIEGFARGSSSVAWEKRMRNGEIVRGADGQPLTPRQAYEKTAGEIEAEDVKKRLNYTDEKRKNTRPDIDRPDAIFVERELVTARKSPYSFAHSEKQKDVDRNDANGYNDNRGEMDEKLRDRSGSRSSNDNLGWERNDDQTQRYSRKDQAEPPRTNRSWSLEERQIGNRVYKIIQPDSYTPLMRSLAEQSVLNGKRPFFTISSDKYIEVDNCFIIPVLDIAKNQYIYDQGVASFTEQRLDSLYEEFGLEGEKYADYSRAYVAYISPDDFLQLTGTEEILDRVRSESDALDLDELRNQQQTPFLEFDTATGEVTGHEGRHRMVALKADGIEQVAVVLKPSTDSFERREPQRIELIGQNFAGGRASGKVDIAHAIPLSEKYRTEIMAEFAENPDADVRYSLPRDKKITPGMSEQERYEVLKDRSITVAVADADSIAFEDSELLQKPLKKTDAKKLLRRIGDEFSVFKDYENVDVELTFDFGKNNLDESVNKQKGNYNIFAQMLSCFSNVISNAIGIEMHNRNDEGYKPDPTLKKVYVLCSAFETADSIIPVKLSIKEFADKPNRLYVAVALEGIKKDRVVSMGVPKDRSHVRTSPVTISISEIFKNVNPKDEKFLKYVPDEFLDTNQRLAKKEALAEDDLKYGRTNPRYSIPRNAKDLSHTELFALVDRGEMTSEEAFQVLREQYGTLEQGVATWCEGSLY